MKDSILALLLLMVSTCYCFAQHQELDTTSINSSVDGFYVALVPSALSNPWTGYQAKVSYGFFDNFQLQLNGGFLYGKRSGYKFNGYRIRPAVKMFFLSSGAFDRFYIGLEYNIRKIVEKGEANYSRFGGAYREVLPFERIKKSRSFILSFGSRSYVQEGFYIETGLGLGVGPINVTTTQYPNAEHLADFEIFRSYQEQGEYSMINLLIHVSIGVKIF